MEEQNKDFGYTIIAMIFFILICFICFFLVSCTLSFQNVMTSGTSSDVIDTEPKTDANVNAKVVIP